MLAIRLLKSSKGPNYQVRITFSKRRNQQIY